MKHTQDFPSGPVVTHLLMQGWRRFDLWSGEDPTRRRASGHLEPQPRKPMLSQPMLSGKLLREASAPQLECSPTRRSSQEAHTQQGRPSTAKKRKK